MIDDGLVRVAYDPQAQALSVALVPAQRVDKTVEVEDGVLLDFEGDEVGHFEVLRSTLPDSIPVIAARYGFAHKIAACYRAVAMATGIQASGGLKLTLAEATSRFAPSPTGEGE